MPGRERTVATMGDVLKDLRETHEEDGSPVAVCDPECQKTFVVSGKWCRTDGLNTFRHRGGHCPDCGALLTDAVAGAGSPQLRSPARVRFSRIGEALDEARAERDRYRRALEWAALREPTGVRVALAATEEERRDD